MEPRKSFDEFFKSGMTDILQSLEAERKKIRSGLITSFCLMGGGALCMVIAIGASSPVFAVPGALVLVPGIVLWMINQNKKGRFIEEFKQKVVEPLVKFIDPGFEYKADVCIDERDYRKSGLYLEEPDNFRGDDYIQGKRGKTLFCFSELHTQHREASGKNEDWETVFKGLFFIADFNKNFSGRTYVWNEQNPQLNFFSKLFSSFAAQLEKVKLESADFESRFVVYSTDQVEARYILTPSLMERLVALEGLMAPEISFSFVDTNIYVAVPYQEDLFEPSIYYPNDYSKVEKYYNTVEAVLTIIDELELNQRIWSKE